MSKITQHSIKYLSLVLFALLSFSAKANVTNTALELVFDQPNQPAGFVVFQEIGETPVEQGEVFMACGPNDVEDADISYRLFYAPSNQVSEDPTTLPEHDFGSIPGDGGGSAAFGFVLGGLEPGVEYNFYLYQYRVSSSTFSVPSIVAQTAMGEGDDDDDDDDDDDNGGTSPIDPGVNLLSNGDFENGDAGWSGNALNVVTEEGNSYNAANIEAAGNPWDVNISYVLNIPEEGVDFILSFDAWSDTTRPLIAGIGLNQDPWTNVNEEVTLTTSVQNFELEFTSNFASPTSRVIFDMGHATGAVNIDNVVLVIAGGSSEEPGEPSEPEFTIVQDFENEASFEFEGFEGLAGATIEAAPTGDNGNSLKLEIVASGMPWQGAFVDQLDTFLDLTDNKTIQVDVYATQAFHLLFKVEDGNGPDAAASQSYTEPNTWQTLTFTMDEALDGTGVANGIYSRFVVFPNWNDTDSGFNTPPSTFTAYIDNVTAVASPADGGGEPVEPGEPGEIGEESVSVDASANWLGFANVFNLPSENDGVFIFASEWGVADLRTDIDTENNTLTLFPNFNTYANNPGDEFWINPTTGEGNKIFEGITFVESTALAGNILEFTGTVESFTISPEYTVTAFIRVFNADFSFNKSVVEELTGTGDFELLYDDVDLENDVTVQYGFTVIGVNANPANEAALGNVVVGPVSLSNTRFETIDVQVYPNPVSDILTIQSANILSSVELYSINGRLVFKQNNVNSIDMRDYSNGMYLLKITSEGQSITKKIIKK